MDKFEPNDYTKELEALLLDIAKTAAAEGKRYYLGGGFGIDIQYGQLTRDHEDLDFHPDEKDTQFWKNWFKDKGFIISKDPDMEDYPNSFLPTNDNKDYIADVYPVTFESDGRISMLYIDGSQGVWDGKDWRTNKEISYKGVPIWVEDYKNILEQKRHGGPMTEKHLHDFKLFNEDPETSSG